MSGLITGIFVNDKGLWVAGEAYGLLDSVYYAPSTYICRTAHSGVTTTPEEDIDAGANGIGTNWRLEAKGVSGDSLESITGPDATTGAIVITDSDDVTHPFNAGHLIQQEESNLTFRNKLNFKGEVNVIDDSSNESTDVYGHSLKLGTVPSGSTSLLILGNLIDNVPTTIVRSIQGTENEIEITPGTGSGNDDRTPIIVGAPQIPINQEAQESLVGENGTIRSIRDVSGIEPANGDVYVYNSVTKSLEPKHAGSGTLNGLSDFDGTGAVDGDIIEFINRAGRFDIEPLHVSNGSGLSIKTPGGELITSPDGYPPIRQINIIWNHDQATSDRVISLSNGNTHVDIVINFSFPENIDNVITEINSILNMTQYTSFYSWGDTTNVGDRERDINDNGDGFHTLVGDWSTKDNTRVVSASGSSGSIGFQDNRHGGEGSFDVVNFKFSIETEGFYVHQQRIIINGVGAASFAAMNALVLAGIKTITDIETHFTITSPSDGIISFVSKATGAEWNGTLYINFFSTTEPQQDPSGTVGPFGGAHGYLRDGQVASSSQVVEWTDTSNRQLENISFINCISFFKNGGDTYKVVTPSAVGTSLISTFGELDTFRGSGFTAGSEFVVTGAAVTAPLTVALAAKASIEFPAAPDNSSLLGLTGMFNGTNDSFFQIRTASDPDVTPTTVFFGNFAAQAGDVFMRQNNGIQLLFLNQADGANDGTTWATNTLALFNTMVTAGDTGIQAEGNNSTITGAFISANCTAEIIGDRTLVFTANEAGVTGGAALSEASDTDNNYTTTFVQGAAATRTVSLTQNNKYVVLNSTTLLNITDGTTISVI